MISLGENMKLTWMKWSALPVAVLMAGSVALAQDQSSSGSQQASPAQAATPAPAAAPAEKPSQPPAKPGFQADLCRQAQRQYGALRQQQGGPAARKPAGPHRARREERPTDGRRNGQAGESTKGHQQTSCRGPQGQWRDADGFREETDQ